MLVTVLVATAVVLAVTVSVALWYDAPLPDDADLLVAKASVSDAENGYLHFVGIGSNFEYDAKVTEMMDWDDDPAPWDAALASKVLDDHAELLDALDGALKKPRWQFPAMDFTTRWDGLIIIDRSMRLKRIEAHARLHDGAPEGALESAFDLLRLGMVCVDADHSVIMALLGQTAYALGSDTIDFILRKPVGRAAIADGLATATELRIHPAMAAGNFRGEYAAVRNHVTSHTAKEIVRIATSTTGEPTGPYILYKPYLALGYRAEFTRELIANLSLPLSQWVTPITDDLISWSSDEFSLDWISPNATGQKGAAETAALFRVIAEGFYLTEFSSAKNQLALALRLH